MRPALLAFALLAPAAARAQTQPGAAILRIPVSASVAAMGGAYAAIAGGVDSLGVNPAGVAASPAPELETSFHTGVLADQYGFLGYAQPTKYGVPFIGLSYYNSGTVGLNFSSGQQSTVVAEQDDIAMLGWAQDFGGGLSAGVMAKAFRSDLAQQASATGFAGDFGALWKTPLAGLSLGACVQNAGAGVKFENATDPLPLTERAGAAYTKSWRPEGMLGDYYTALDWTVDADAVRTLGEQAYPAAGTELAIDMGKLGRIALRAGWDFDPQAATNLSFGLGLTEGRFTLAYAQAGAGELGNIEYGSLSIRF